MYGYVKNGIITFPVKLEKEFFGVADWNLLSDEQRAKFGFFPVVEINGDFDPATQKRHVAEKRIVNGKIEVTYQITEITQEELMAKARDEMVRSIEQLIQSEIDKYNEANGVLFKDIDACAKYVNIPSYTHYQFCIDVISWQTNVWETARQIQSDVLAGTRTMPTEKELLSELPTFGV